MTHNPTRLYLAAPALSAAALAAATAALLAAGFLVATATPSEDLDAVADDLDAVAAADAVVTVGDCSKLFEPVMAEAFGVPVVALADVLSGAA
ncbi:hypothetical protein [Micromonospora sp. NPDC007230]|uniref:hypothetical protein n=1 Tax=Micromonospora sp. NPDC007230 TaxID=3364237 RepID=UPI0036AA4DE4